MNGILVLDKPVGITSNAALQRIKRLFQANKAGHTGSLDPLASGLLPLCMGEATKISSFLLNTDKTYIVDIHLGVVTDTGDAEGRVIATNSVPNLQGTMIESVLAGFIGEVSQIPPMFSALKYRGERLYDLARKGVEVEREARTVTIYAIRLLGWSESSLELEVHCSKGTYIRTLAEDIGKAIGCGGSVRHLRRTRVGDFEIAHAWTPAQLSEMDSDEERLACLLPVDAALGGCPPVTLSEDLVFFVKNGQAVFVPKAPLNGFVRIYNNAGVFLGIAEMLDNSMLAPRRLFRTIEERSGVA
ncbi:MAG: tRNA pseudouridine(55) synthase TruB [Pseudomonadota bacterium]